MRHDGRMNPTTARNIVRWILRGSAVVAMGTGASVVACGAGAIPAGGTSSPSTDSVLRFYAVWWGGAGLLMLRAASEPERHPALVRDLAAVTLAGGMARLRAARQSGRPHLLFRVLTVTELVVPPLLLAVQSRSRPHGGHDIGE